MGSLHWQLDPREAGSNVLGIAMCGIGHFGQRRQVVQPIQVWFLGDWVHSAEQQIDSVGTPRPQAAGQFAPDKVGNGSGAQFGIVTHRVQLDVGLDKLGELH